MIDPDDVTKKNIKEHNPNWSGHQHIILIIGGCGSRKAIFYSLL